MINHLLISQIFMVLQKMWSAVNIPPQRATGVQKARTVKRIANLTSSQKDIFKFLCVREYHSTSKGALEVLKDSPSSVLSHLQSHI